MTQWFRRGFEPWIRPLCLAVLGLCPTFIHFTLNTENAEAGPNADVAIVLHAQAHADSNSCTTPEKAAGLDCSQVAPVTTVAPGQPVDVYVYLHRYKDIGGCQMAFQWPDSWTFEEWHGYCPSRAMAAVTPSSESKDLVVVFDPVTSGELIPIGWLSLTAGVAGSELKVGETWAPGGTGVIDSKHATDPVLEQNRGVIRVQGPGVNACPPPDSSSTERAPKSER
jgi:hypothetical protein